MVLTRGSRHKILPAIDDATEQPGSLFGIVNSRMGLLVIPRKPGRLGRLGQHGLPVGQTAQGHRVEGTEGMERILLNARAGYGGIEET